MIYKNIWKLTFKNPFLLDLKKKLQFFFLALKTPGSNKTSPRQRKTQKHAGSDTEWISSS